MTHTELAPLLGISISMVGRLAKRGMPVDTLEKAERWRKRNLSPARVKGNRYDAHFKTAAAPKPAPVLPVPMEFDALALRADHAVERGDFASVERRLRNALRELGPDATPRMTLRVWIALTSYHMAEDAEVRQIEITSTLTPDEFGLLASRIPNWGTVWLFAACDRDDITVNGWPITE